MFVPPEFPHEQEPEAATSQAYPIQWDQTSGTTLSFKLQIRSFLLHSLKLIHVQHDCITEVFEMLQQARRDAIHMTILRHVRAYDMVMDVIRRYWRQVNYLGHVAPLPPCIPLSSCGSASTTRSGVVFTLTATVHVHSVSSSDTSDVRPASELRVATISFLH